jgi:hypothetical protein
MSAAPAFTVQAPGDLTATGRGWRREALLSGLAADQREVDAAEARKLRRITDWADLHRADAAESFADEALLPGHGDHSMPILMSGVPVDEFCLAELATALRCSHGAARARTEEALEVRERLPRLWDKVHIGALPAWKALAVAKETLSLSDDAADHVDRHLAPFARSLTVGRIKNLVAAAILRFDPDRAAADAAAASDARGVWFDFEHGAAELPTTDARPDGTARFEGVGDVPAVLAFRDALTSKARELAILGDESSADVRMSKAIGILADPQYALDLTATVEAAVAEEPTDEAPPRRRPHRARSPLGIERPIHVHLHTSTQTARIGASGLPQAASPISREAVEQWVRDLAPGAVVKVTPVVDLNHHHAVDAYEAPDFVRALVDERDGTCVFPFCTNRGRYDLDHIDEYVDPDDGGPPGQTGNRSLGKLCRYHHRAKTHTTWTYKRIDHPDDLDPHWDHPWIEGSGPGLDKLDHRRRFDHHDACGPETGGPPAAYVWISPLGFHYLVTSTGTYPLA